jgi:hypothetical protein
MFIFILSFLKLAPFDDAQDKLVFSKWLSAAKHALRYSKGHGGTKEQRY